MRITTLVSATAIALTATIGSVSAADQFATLGGVSATPMSSGELDAVKGMHRHFVDGNGKNHVIPSERNYNNGSIDALAGELVIQGYHGLCPAAGAPNGDKGISIPGFGNQC